MTSTVPPKTFSPYFALKSSTAILTASTAVWSLITARTSFPSVSLMGPADAPPPPVPPPQAAAIKTPETIAAKARIVVLLLPRLDAEVTKELALPHRDRGIIERLHDLPLGEEIVTVRDGRRKAQVLLHQQRGQALAFRVQEHLAKLLDEDRREPLCRLVEQEDAGAHA